MHHTIPTNTTTNYNYINSQFTFFILLSFVLTLSSSNSRNHALFFLSNINKQLSDLSQLTTAKLFTLPFPFTLQKLARSFFVSTLIYTASNMAENPISGDMSKLSLKENGGSAEKNHLVVCFGELLIDFVPPVSGVSLAEAPSFKKAPGGAPANVAVCIAKLGGSAAFIGKVGDDEFGRMLANILKENKVNISAMRFDPYARTALAFVTLRADGEREFMFYRHPSADMLFRESELDVDLVKKAAIFHYGSIGLIEEPCRSTQLAAMDIAKKSGSLLSYDPNLRLPLWPSEKAARNEIMSVWNKADIIKISEDEISFLTDGEDPYDDNVVLTRLFHPNLQLLLVSEGKDGCRYYTKEFKGRVSGVKVKPVDTTGAGDAFVGAILYCLAADLNLFKDETRLREALFFANACGALTVTENGAIPALPTKDAVQQIMAAQKTTSS